MYNYLPEMLTMYKWRFGRKGFTFVELIVSVGILGFVLTGLLRFFVEMISLNAISRDLALAVSHSEYVLEDIRSSSGVIISQIDNQEWDWATDGVFSAKGLVRLKNEVIDVSHDDSTPPIITVNVSWQMENGRIQNLTFKTIDSGV